MWWENWKKWEIFPIFKKSSRQATDYNQYAFAKLEYVRYVLEAVIVSALVSYIFYRNLIIFLLSLPFTLYYPLFKRKELIRMRKKLLETEFKEGIQILAALLSAGYSVENALKESVDEIRLIYGEKGLIVKEFSYLSHLVYMNVPIEKAFEDFGERSGIDDIRNFARVLKIAKRSGGELIPIINHTVGIINDKQRMKEDILTLTTAKRFEQKIMNLFPFLIVLYIDMSSPGFFSAMYTTILGRIMMTLCLLGYILALYLSSRILAIEV